MNGKPLVSVVMIFLNGERFIREAIESVRAQTWDSWELLLVDDGSDDGSTAIALSYAHSHPERIRYVEHDGHRNRGMSASRNLGVRNSRGRYIALLDADDVWLPEKLEQQVSVLESRADIAMVYGPGRYWHSWTGLAGDRGRDTLQKLWVPPGTPLLPPALLTRFLRKEEAVPLPSSILIRREAVERVGGFEDAFRGMYEDQAFFSKVCLALPVLADGRCGLLYRKHPDGCCAVSKKEGRTRAARIFFLRWLNDYLSRQEVEDEELRALVLRELSFVQPTLKVRIKQAARSRLRSLKRILTADSGCT